MKVLHVVYQSLPQVVGSTIRTRDLLWAQAEEGLEVLAVSSPFQRGVSVDSGDEFVEGVRHIRMYCGDTSLEPSDVEKGIRTRIRRMATLPSFSRSLLRIAAQFQPDIIHAHAMFYCALAAHSAARQLGVPLVYEVRSLWDENPLLRRSVGSYVSRPIVRMLEREAMRRADLVVAINKGLASALETQGVSSRKLVVVGNAVRSDLFAASRPLLSSRTASGLRFGYVGSITDLEGIDLLLEAFRLSKLGNEGSSLDIYGGGPALAAIAGGMASSRITGVTLHGPTGPDEARRALQGLDVAVMPRRKNAVSDSVTPLKPLEAMAAGTLVLASDVGGMRELISDGETGILFEHGNVNALAASMRTVWARAQLGELNRLVSDAKTFVEKHRSWRANGRRYQELYSKLIAARSSDRT